ncbi:hypothetical protein SAMN06273570_4558 [Candidatus Pantoea floridensis]|uniref:Uncharacterized protein n=1 Tax=Candidatus Pantoea floridensis TaxID=1938870 RepID=A0A286DN34_9GAMM|nr:hypothetical protein BX596_3656 [Enterobacteriaceae bacterium JKS000233]SOD60033.1 hypothetical protein SAMN06273570_4558 [Pantoea floridensis]
MNGDPTTGRREFRRVAIYGDRYADLLAYHGTTRPK